LLVLTASKGLTRYTKREPEDQQQHNTLLVTTALRA
jgi:hypothetical protein